MGDRSQQPDWLAQTKGHGVCVGFHRATILCLSYVSVKRRAVIVVNPQNNRPASLPAEPHHRLEYLLFTGNAQVFTSDAFNRASVRV
jgi:hypothetical protein